MFYLIKIFFKDPWIFVPLIISAVAQLFMWPYIIFHAGAGASGMMFLHYNIIFGVDYVGEWWKIFAMPGIGLGIIILNFGGAIYSYNADKLLSRMVTVFTAALQIFLAVAVYFIVDINL